MSNNEDDAERQYKDIASPENTTTTSTTSSPTTASHPSLSSFVVVTPPPSKKTQQQQHHHDHNDHNDNEIDFNTEYSALMLAGKALCLAGDKKRYSQRRELLTLRANKWIPAKKNLKQQQTSTDMDLYRSTVQQVFLPSSSTDERDEEKNNTTSSPCVDNEEELTEGRVLKLQIKLCHALHWHEIQVKQIHLLKRHNKMLVKDVLRKEYKDLDENVESQKIQEQISKIEDEIQRLSDEYNTKIQKQHRQIDALKHLIEVHSIGSPEVSQHSTTTPSTPETGGKSKLGVKLNEEGQILISTPPILKKSKIWNDLKRADEKDASRLWNVRKKCGLGLSSHGSSHITNHRNSDLGLHSPNASSSSLNHASFQSLNHSFSLHSPLNAGSSSSPKTKKIPGLRNKSSSSTAGAATSMFSSILGNIGLADSFDNGDMNDINSDDDSFHIDDDGDSFHDDDDDDYATPRATKKSVTNQVTSFFSSSIVDDITSAVVGGVDIGGGGEPLSPTSQALKDLTKEVFSS